MHMSTEMQPKLDIKQASIHLLRYKHLYVQLLVKTYDQDSLHLNSYIISKIYNLNITIGINHMYTQQL